MQNIDRSSNLARDVALVGTFAALIAVCSIIPGFTPAGMAVPITLQTFAVMLAGAVLGWRRGALAVLLFIAVGLAGLPVFSGGAGGIGVLARPSMGYVIAWPMAAALAGALVQAFARRGTPLVRGIVIFTSCMAGSLLFTHPLGITVMGARLGLSADEAIRAGLMFLPGDIIKNTAVAVVAVAVHRAFPRLLPPLRQRHRTEETTPAVESVIA